jgi:hypothetical protein
MAAWPLEAHNRVRGMRRQEIRTAGAGRISRVPGWMER